VSTLSSPWVEVLVLGDHVMICEDGELVAAGSILAGAELRCAGPGQTEVASSTRDQIAKISSSNATASRLLVGSSTASS
jgi:hypothetical protein